MEVSVLRNLLGSHPPSWYMYGPHPLGPGPWAQFLPPVTSAPMSYTSMAWFFPQWAGPLTALMILSQDTHLLVYTWLLLVSLCICLVFCPGPGGTTFRPETFPFLADFRWFQGKFHHFCESSKSGLKFFFGGVGPETLLRCQLDNSEATMLLQTRLHATSPITLENMPVHLS